MIKVSIKNKATQQITHGATFATQAEVDQWIDSCESICAWGKPQHQVEVTPAIYNDAGELIQAAVLETVLCEYEIIQEDISARLQQEAVNAQARAYLASTDWLIIREQETGAPCPADIKSARQAARDSVVELT